MPTPRQQRLKDYVDSPIMGVSVSHDYLKGAIASLELGFGEKKSNLNFPNGNHFTQWAIPACILFVNSLEVFLHEVISYLAFEKTITEAEKEKIGKILSLIDRLIATQNVLQQSPSAISNVLMEDLKLAVELRNDLTHYFPRVIFKDDVNVELDKKGLLIEDNVAGRKHASYHLAKWVAECSINVAIGLTEDLNKYYLGIGVTDNMAMHSMGWLKGNFVNAADHIKNQL